MSKVDVRVRQGDDALLTFSLSRRRFKVKGPYPLTGVEEIEFIVKAGKETADGDADALYSLTGGAVVVVDETAGHLSVQLAGADMADAGKRWYKLRVIKDGKGETPAYGALIVEDT